MKKFNNPKAKKLLEWERYKKVHNIKIDRNSEELLINTALENNIQTIEEVYEAYEESDLNAYLREIEEAEHDKN